MKIKDIKIEAIDENTGLVLKRMVTDKGEFLNRKLSVPNTIYVCEKARIIFNNQSIRYDYWL